MNRSLSRQISDALLTPGGLEEEALREAIEADPEAAAYLADLEELDSTLGSWSEAGLDGAGLDDAGLDDAAFEAMAARLEEGLEQGLDEELEELEGIEDPAAAPIFLASELEPGDPEGEAVEAQLAEGIEEAAAVAAVAVVPAVAGRAPVDRALAAAAPAPAQARPAKVASIEAAREKRGGLSNAWWIGGLAAAAAALLGIFAGTATFTGSDDAVVANEAMAPTSALMPSAEGASAAATEAPRQAPFEEPEPEGAEEAAEGEATEEAGGAADDFEMGVFGEATTALAGERAPAPQAAAMPAGAGGGGWAASGQGSFEDGVADPSAASRRARQRAGRSQLGRAGYGVTTGGAEESPFRVAGGGSSPGSSHASGSGSSSGGGSGGGSASSSSRTTSSGASSGASSAGTSAGAPSDRADVLSALRGALRRARRSCHIEGSPQPITLRVEVSPSGQIRRVALSGLSSSQSAHQSCVRGAIGRTRIEGWSGGPTMVEADLDL